jgi:hypothetical protein
MTTAATKQTLQQMLDDALFGPGRSRIDWDAEPIWREIDRIGAAGPYKGLRVFNGGAAVAPAQPLPPLRPRRPLW